MNSRQRAQEDDAYLLYNEHDELTCAGHSYYVARFADRVIHDGHDTELVPRLLRAGEQREQR